MHSNFTAVDFQMLERFQCNICGAWGHLGVNHYDTCPDVIATLEKHAKAAESENALIVGWKDNFERRRRYEQRRGRGYGRGRGGRSFGSRNYGRRRGPGSFLSKAEFDEFVKIK